MPAASLLRSNLDFYSLGRLLRLREVTGHTVNEETETGIRSHFIRYLRIPEYQPESL